MDFPATFAEARPQLVARLVGRTPLGIRALRLALDGASDALDATAPVAADVLVGLALDRPGAGGAVTETMLRQWGVTLEQALAASFEVHGGEHPRVESIDGAVLVTDRSYAAYLLRTPDAATRLLGGGTAVALAPTDHHLVLARRESPAALAAAARTADRLVQDDEARLVSSVALALTGSAWTPIALPASAEPAASDLQRRFAARMYGEQRPLLQAFYDRTGQHCAVPDATLVRTPQGALRLVTALTEGEPAALAWVDDVSLVRPPAVLGLVPMARLAAASGVLTPLPDLDPPRFYAHRLPGELLG